VRHSLLVPPVFILIFLVVFISLTSVHTLISFGVYFSDSHDPGIAFILQKIPYSMAYTLPASVLLTILLMLFRLIRSPGNKLISSLLLTISGFLILVFGMIILIPALPAEKANPRVYKDYIEAQRFNRIDDVLIYPSRILIPNLPNVLVVVPGKEDWKFSHLANARLVVTGTDLVLSGEGFAPKRISSDSKTKFGALLEEDLVISGVLSAFSVFAEELRKLATTRATEFFLLGFAFVFFFVSSGVLLKITKWPLLNLSLMLFVVIGTLLLFAFYQTQVVPELGKYVKSGLLSTATPTIVMLILGLLFTLIDLIFIPSHFWRKEIEGV
jgi:hypothetical protein